jgi:hypothetical protein
MYYTGRLEVFNENFLVVSFPSLTARVHVHMYIYSATLRCFDLDKIANIIFLVSIN